MDIDMDMDMDMDIDMDIDMDKDIDSPFAVRHGPCLTRALRDCRTASSSA